MSSSRYSERGVAGLFGGLNIYIFLRHGEAVVAAYILQELQQRRDREALLLLRIRPSFASSTTSDNDVVIAMTAVGWFVVTGETRQGRGGAAAPSLPPGARGADIALFFRGQYDRHCPSQSTPARLVRNILISQ